MGDLGRVLERMDGQGYGRYKSIKGDWFLPGFTLRIDHVQGDPFAAPSRVRVLLPASRAAFPEWTLRPGPRIEGLASHLARAFAAAAASRTRRDGSGKSGEIRMEAPGQEVLPQSAVLVHGDGSVEARFTIGLPGNGRRVAGRQAVGLLTRDVPALVESTLLGSAHGAAELKQVVETNEDADALRRALPSLGLLGFVADGSILPRRSGVDDRPLDTERAVPFRAPDSLRVELDSPNAGKIRGMGVPKGVTLIVGGGYHGKSTLLRALERGVYNHRAGDGRERVVTDPTAVKVRAEDGRSVSGVDISRFIRNLPDGSDTRAFTSSNASGSTSQAAAISEALEVGAEALLVDEDTAATNFMIRDRRMQALVPSAAEPITPFVDRVRELWEQEGVSSVLVIGGSGDYLEVADTVIAMRAYRAEDVTEQAARIVRDLPTGRLHETGSAPAPLPRRVPVASSVDPSRGRRAVSVKARGRERIEFGTTDIELGAVEQIVCRAQTRAVSDALVLARSFMDGERSMAEVFALVMDRIAEEGLDALDDRCVGDLAGFRRFELAAALDRLRTLAVRVNPK